MFDLQRRNRRNNNGLGLLHISFHSCRDTKKANRMSLSENPFQEPIPAKGMDRRLILIAGVVLLASLGSVYAWSFFTRPLQEAYHWSNAQVSIVFSLAVAGLGFAALYTGPLVSKLGGRRLMKRSAVFFVAGYLIAALGLFLGSGVIGSIEDPFVSWLSFLVLAFGYGVVGGIGLGTGYVTAVSTVAGWFPDKKGFATGMIVMGFGMGALFMSKVFAPFAMNVSSGNVAIAFLFIAGVYAVIMTVACRFIYSPHAATAKLQKITVADTYEHGVDVRIRMWMVCFLYSLAGLGVISLLSPMMQSLVAAKEPGMGAAELAAIGATLIAFASIGNSVGRLLWAWVSDAIGRVNTFIIMLGTSTVAYLLVPQVNSPLLFGILICYCIACYGGSFGTIPSLISDLFGPKRMSAMHGLVLTGWAVAGLTAPPFFGYMRDAMPETATTVSFYICGASLFLATIVVWTFKGIHRECVVEVKQELKKAA
jgi:MFS transporter, OFA family, oxalate/formate antiporter